MEAKTSGINRLSFPKWEVVKWEVPVREDLPPVTFTWHAGNCPESRERIEDLLGRGLDWGDQGEKKWADWAGHLVVGSKGKILANGHNTVFTMIPEDEFKEVKKDAPQTVDASRGHESDWLNACRGGKPAWANFDYAGALTEFNMLGNVATQFEGKLEFEPAGRITIQVDDRSYTEVFGFLPGTVGPGRFYVFGHVETVEADGCLHFRNFRVGRQPGPDGSSRK